MVSENTFMITAAMAANVRDLRRNLESQIEDLDEIVEVIGERLIQEMDENAALKKKLKDEQDERAIWNAGTAKAIENFKTRISQLEGENASLRERNKELDKQTTAWAIYASCHIARAHAYERQVAHMIKQHPDSPLLAVTGSGKTHLQNTYDRAYAWHMGDFNLTNERLRELSVLGQNFAPIIKSLEIPETDEPAAAAGGPKP